MAKKTKDVEIAEAGRRGGQHLWRRCKGSVITSRVGSENSIWRPATEAKGSCTGRSIGYGIRSTRAGHKDGSSLGSSVFTRLAKAALLSLDLEEMLARRFFVVFVFAMFKFAAYACTYIYIYV